MASPAGGLRDRRLGCCLSFKSYSLTEGGPQGHGPQHLSLPFVFLLQPERMQTLHVLIEAMSFSSRASRNPQNTLCCPSPLCRLEPGKPEGVICWRSCPTRGKHGKHLPSTLLDTCAVPIHSFQLTSVRLETSPRTHPLSPLWECLLLQGFSQWKSQSPSTVPSLLQSGTRNTPAEAQSLCMHRFSSWLLCHYTSRTLREVARECLVNSIIFSSRENAEALPRPSADVVLSGAMKRLPRRDSARPLLS